MSDGFGRVLRPRRRSPPGSPPGTLLVDPQAPTPSISLMGYGSDGLQEDEVSDIDSLDAVLRSWPVTWVNVDGLGNADIIQRLGEVFGLHDLALEDVINVHQRPKAEDYQEYIFIVTLMTTAAARIETEQISIFLGRNFVLTFQERPGDCFDLVRSRLRKKRGRIRDAGPDYLAYALLDATIDTYFPILEEFGERVDELENSVLSMKNLDDITRAHDLRMRLLNLRRIIWPQRDMLGALLCDTSPLIDERTDPYLRDCYDHTVQLIDMLETYREISSSLVEIYLSGISSRTNEIMKVLTMIATIFIPLGFVASLYGMNFDPAASPWNMPELKWRWGYPAVLGLMAAIAAGLLVFFRRRRWFGS